jgi:hypothetical protein
MKKLIFMLLPLCAVCLFSIQTPAQKASVSQDQMRGAGHVVVIVVKTAGKVTLETAKFAGKYMVKPVAKSVLKPMITKLLPNATVFALKVAGKAVTRATPAVARLSLKYLKFKLPV